MNDPRVELSRLINDRDASLVLRALDTLRPVIELEPGCGTSRSDQAGLYNLVNQLGRLFAHLDIKVPTGIPCRLQPVAEGDLKTVLDDLADSIRPAAAACDPAQVIYLRWGGEPAGDGLALDAAGWTCSLGPTHLPIVQPDDRPAVAALAVGCFAAGQLLGRALQSLGMPGHRTTGFTWNLLTYTNSPAPSVPAKEGDTLPPMSLLGCGSVGTSMMYAGRLAGVTGGPAELVDPDSFTPRNVLRYPILLERTDEPKPTWLARLLRDGGIAAQAHVTDVNGYTNSFDEPPAIDLAVVSADTIEGRRDAVDLLAATTINIGVAGLALHISRHGFDEDGCGYCQYVDVAPSLSGAQQLAELVGLPVERVISIQQLQDGRLTAQDAALAAQSGRFSGPAPQPGDRLADLQRRAYAQATVAAGDSEARVTAPYVSGLAGVLALAEALKHRDPHLARYALAGRCDIDLTGEPTGYTAPVPRDRSGRCLCHSGFRRKVHGELHPSRDGSRAAADSHRSARPPEPSAAPAA